MNKQSRRFMANKARIGATMLMLTLLLSGCISPEPRPDDPIYAPVITASREAPEQNLGSLYQSGYEISLFTDRRAARVGDVLMVTLDERTTSSKKSDTDIKKENDLQFGAGTVFGQGITNNGNDLLSASINQKRKFAGASASDQSNRLQGSITVTVSEVLPNGLLVVRGEKWMTLTNGEEFIRVRGLVRQADINPDNTISSTKLADARITYSGTGEFADSGRQGWGSRFFNTKWWPF